MGSRYYVIQAAVNTVAVLRAFTKGKPSLGPTEISNTTGIGRTVVQKLVLTLLQEGLLRRDPQTRKYSLSPRVMEFARSFRSSSLAASEGTRYVAQLVKRTNASCTLAIRDGLEALVIASRESSAILRAVAATGDRNPLHCTAAGKCLLAFSPESVRESVVRQLDLDQYTASTIVDRDRLCKELANIRARGYALNRGERVVGLGGCSAPVFGAGEIVIAALGATISVSVMMEPELTQIIAATTQLAADMSSTLAQLGSTDMVEVIPGGLESVSI